MANQNAQFVQFDTIGANRLDAKSIFAIFLHYFYPITFWACISGFRGLTTRNQPFPGFDLLQPEPDGMSRYAHFMEEEGKKKD